MAAVFVIFLITGATLPALPLNVGLELLRLAPFGGVATCTAGGVVSTVKLTGALSPDAFPSELC